MRLAYLFQRYSKSCDFCPFTFGHVRNSPPMPMIFKASYVQTPLDGAAVKGLLLSAEKHKGNRHADHHTEGGISRLGNGTSHQIRKNTGATGGIFVAQPVPGRPEAQAGRSRAQGQPAGIAGAANVDVTRLLHTEKSPQVLPAPGGFRLKCYQHPSQFLTH